MEELTICYGTDNKFTITTTIDKGDSRFKTAKKLRNRINKQQLKGVVNNG